MDSNLKPYEEYKETEYDWLGSVPRHWKEQTVRSITKLSSERNGNRDDLELLSVYREYGVIRKSSRDDNHNVESQDLSNYKFVDSGYLVLNKMKMWQGSLGVSRYRGIVSPAYIVCKLIGDLNHEYIHYLMRSAKFKTVYNRISYGVRVGQWDMRYDDFKNIKLFLPPIAEQSQIVKYLDYQLAKINKFIQAKKQLISILKEQKQALINIAVTKGIKRNVKTKHSGIDILGEVPIEWEVKPLKYYVRSNTETLGETYNKENEISYIDISTVGFGELKRSPVRYKFGEAPSRARRIVHYGDTIISTVRTYLKSMCFIDENIRDCIVSTGFAVLTPNEQVYPKLLNYVLSSNYFVDSVSKNSIGVSYPAISESKLISLKIALPKDINEQREILNYIHEHTTAIDKRLSVAEKEIELINEYRTRLISDVVTGKVDVRNIEVDRIQLYDLPEEIIDTDTIELEETAQNEECEV
jgi:type I restriction enzyme, S subunit